MTDEFHASVRGVEATVTEDGDIADLTFATAGYRTTHTDDLCRAIVAAHRQARTEALETRWGTT